MMRPLIKIRGPSNKSQMNASYAENWISITMVAHMTMKSTSIQIFVPGTVTHIGYFLSDPLQSLDGFVKYKEFLEMNTMEAFRGEMKMLKEGLTLGFKANLFSVEAVPDLIKGVIAAGDDPSSPLLNIAFAAKENVVGASEYYTSDIVPAAVKVLEVLPEYVTFLEDEYISQLNPADISISSRNPRGKEAYNFLIKYHTTTDYDAQYIHDLGKAEAERILLGMNQLATKNGKASVQEYYDFLRASDDQKYASAAEVIAEHQRVAMEASAKLPSLFGLLPRSTLAFDSYPAPSVDGRAESYRGGNPGTFMLNSVFWQTYRKYAAPSLQAHEGLPGHHFQLSLASENDQLSPFVAEYGYTTAYVEGWGLYAEYLGEEMGLYENDAALFGRYAAESLRACRLVVDTGMHYFGWTRQEAKDYMTDHFAGSPGVIESESKRYVGMPGQALAYKIGELAFKRLRAQAELELEDKFIIKDFHDAVLETPLPLSIMEDVVVEWIARVKSQGQ